MSKSNFESVKNMKVRMTLVSMADRYNEDIRTLIYRAYTDPILAKAWREKRNSGAFDKGGSSKVHRQILEFPNGYIFDFVDTTMSSLYGKDWLKDSRALRHDLVKPWWVVSKI